jgi:CheY-like chemotaxis protein
MSKATVLLVEDSKIQKLANERILHKAGYIVLNASDGEEALRMACEKNPDLILLDMLLPKLGGPEVLQALKKDPDTARIPVIVLTGLSQGNEAKLRNAGADGFFEKSRMFKGEWGGEGFYRHGRESAPRINAPDCGGNRWRHLTLAPALRGRWLESVLIRANRRLNEIIELRY